MAIGAVNVRAKPRTRSTSATPVPIHPVGRPQQFKLECSYYAHRTYTSTLVSFHECSGITPVLRQNMVHVKRTRDYVYPLPEEPVKSDSHNCSNISKSSSWLVCPALGAAAAAAAVRGVAPASLAEELPDPAVLAEGSAAPSCVADTSLAEGLPFAALPTLLLST